MNKDDFEIDNKRLNFIEKVQLVVKKEELKEQDIRMNKLCFDYQEKEKRIAELEQKLAKETDRRIYNFNKSIEWKEKHRELKKKIADLEAQIEKMKRCFNCKYHNKFIESKCGECEDYSK